MEDVVQRSIWDFLIFDLSQTLIILFTSSAEAPP